MMTPARKQYLDIKEQHQGAILLYQVGDFYETFDEDARIAARELRIVLTSRAYGPEERVPLAGVPVHALETYAAKLVAAGHNVAICEQVSPPGRGLVRREVTRILTPGTLTDPGLVPPLRDNYLAAVVVARDGKGEVNGAGFAYVEVSAGAFACTEWTGDDARDALEAELYRLAPAEILLPEVTSDHDGPTTDETAWLDGLNITRCPAHSFDLLDARERLLRHFGTRSLAAFGCAERPLATIAAAAIVAYLARMNPNALRLLTDLATYDTCGFVEMDARTWRALEVAEPPHGTREGLGRPSKGQPLATLLGVLDETRTPMGTRLLRRTLRQPLRDRATLEERLDAVDALYADAGPRQRVRALLDGLPDLERLIARVVHGSATARELYSLRAGLLVAHDMRRALRHLTATGLVGVRDALDPCKDVCALIERAVADPWQGDGRVIQPGYSPELDELTRAAGEARAWIAALEATERQRLGVKSLKVTYNAVFGYAIEITRPNLDRAPPEYQRRQTLAHAERFVTPALLEREKIILRAEERAAELERALLAGVLTEIATSQGAMRGTARALAQVDLWQSLAQVADTRGYVRPTLTDGSELAITGGRHPVVEATLDGAAFIANDTALAELDEEGASPRVALLTGPNMAGKSTYLRQVALIVLMAQVGSFVPAQSASIGLVDRIFTRVGAEDDLAAGLSTFMLEMVETAYILRHATAHSLVILDEIGRGTSTDDGMAIARAVIEHIHSSVRARTLFATHYHDLAALARTLPRVALWRMAVVEDGEAPVFLHRLEPGASHHSYGVYVASAAGLPGAVVQRARALLTGDPVVVREPPVRYQPATPATEPSVERELSLALAGLNIIAMTPIEALNILFSLQQRALVALRAERR